MLPHAFCVYRDAGICLWPTAIVSYVIDITDSNMFVYFPISGLWNWQIIEEQYETNFSSINTNKPNDFVLSNCDDEKLQIKKRKSKNSVRILKKKDFLYTDSWSMYCWPVIRSFTDLNSIWRILRLIRADNVSTRVLRLIATRGSFYGPALSFLTSLTFPTLICLFIFQFFWSVKLTNNRGIVRNEFFVHTYKQTNRMKFHEKGDDDDYFVRFTYGDGCSSSVGKSGSAQFYFAKWYCQIYSSTLQEKISSACPHLKQKFSVIILYIWNWKRAV
jgi:hypothetical protein